MGITNYLELPLAVVMLLASLGDMGYMQRQTQLPEGGYRSYSRHVKACQTNRFMNCGSSGLRNLSAVTKGAICKFLLVELSC